MIVHLTGNIITSTIDYIILDVNGVGYKVYTTKFSAKNNGETVSLWTYYFVGSDNQPALYGFQSQESYELFQQFLKVQGVGPKIALKIIESSSPEQLKQAILSRDISFFTKIKGLGKKGAQKIILELQNILVEPVVESNQNSTIIEALTSLGFSHREISDALEKVDISNNNDSEAIEKILQYLGR